MFSKEFAQTTIDVRGDSGVEWLRRLPDTIAECERRWSLTVLPPFPELSYSYVAPAVRADGSDAVLKLWVPHPEFTNEIDALRHFDGRGCVAVIEADPNVGSILMERLTPGTMLATLDDDQEATSIAAGLMKFLRRPAPSGHRLPTLAEGMQGLGRLRASFDGPHGPLPLRLLERAEAAFAELDGTEATPILLHGDLHQYNILTAERAPWLAIDPKGVVGAPEYEVCQYLGNRLFDRPEPERVLARRIDQFSDELGFDRQRVVGWAMVHGVRWSYDHEGSVSERNLAYAEMVARLLR